MTLNSNENLLETILSKENLNAAWKHVRSNKGAAGIDGITPNKKHKPPTLLGMIHGYPIRAAPIDPRSPCVLRALHAKNRQNTPYNCALMPLW
ncbi:hypothetical protein ACJJIE_10760 [Microbulbifer sp. TRSA001]|uniref:hypothetical protein n=1 Tax=Microbulbifer sp. TRSA001 TaxID=3243381 RepID=UPI00403A2D53